MNSIVSKIAGYAAYFDSVDGRTPPRWSSTSLSRSQTALANLDEVFDGFQRARCKLSRLGVRFQIDYRQGFESHPTFFVFLKFIKLFFLCFFYFHVRVRFRVWVRDLIIKI